MKILKILKFIFGIIIGVVAAIFTGRFLDTYKKKNNKNWIKNSDGTITVIDKDGDGEVLVNLPDNVKAEDIQAVGIDIKKEGVKVEIKHDVTDRSGSTHSNNSAK